MTQHQKEGRLDTQRNTGRQRNIGLCDLSVKRHKQCGKVEVNQVKETPASVKDLQCPDCKQAMYLPPFQRRQ